MAEKSKLQIIVEAVTGNAVKGIDKVEQGLSKMEKTAQVGKMTWTELTSKLNVANQVFSAAQGFIRDTAGEVVNYANQVRSLTTAIGATPEEASKLIQVADDVGISFGQLNSALEAGIRKGVKPTIENIGKMSDEYLALNPGIERSEYLMENFGRTGTDLARIMELGSGKIEEMGDSIEGTAMLMDQDALDAAEDYRLALDSLSDSVYNVKLGIGKGLIPELQKVADVMTRNIEITNILNAAEDAGLITAMERTRAGSFLFGSEAANMRQVEEIAKKLEGYNKMLADAEKRSRGAGRATDEHREAVTTLDGTLQSANRELDEQQAILDGIVSPAKEAANATLAIAAAEQEAYRNARNWKSGLGETVGLLERLNTMDMNFGDKIKTQLDQMAWDAAGGDTIQNAADRVNKALEAGRITPAQAEEMLKELAIASDTLAADINGTKFGELTKNLQDGFHIPLDEAKTKATAAIDAIKAGALEKYIYTIELRYIKMTSGGLPEEFKADGGPVRSGRAYVVGERGPELFVPPVSGNIVPNEALADASGGFGGGGSPILNVTINTLPGQSAEAIAGKVVSMLSRQGRRGSAGLGYAGA